MKRIMYGVRLFRNGLRPIIVRFNTALEAKVAVELYQNEGRKAEYVGKVKL